MKIGHNMRVSLLCFRHHNRAWRVGGSAVVVSFSPPAKTPPTHRSTPDLTLHPDPSLYAMAASKTDPSFFENVFDVVRLIPNGRVTSYGAIARYLGSGRSARLVGWAMNLSHSTGPSIPAHRVVNRNGMLSGKHHFGAPDRMQKLLEAEGIVIVEDQIQDFKSHYWDPNEALDLER